MAKENLKGLILSGGKGERLRPFTYTGAKQLVPIASKPVLFYAIEDLAACGMSDIGIVVGEADAIVSLAAQTHVDRSLMRALGWAPRHGFYEALAKTVAWYVDNEWWWQKARSGAYKDYYQRQYGWRLEATGRQEGDR